MGEQTVVQIFFEEAAHPRSHRLGLCTESVVEGDRSGVGQGHLPAGLTPLLTALLAP